MPKMKRDNFGNPIYDQPITVLGKTEHFPLVILNFLKERKLLDNDENATMFSEALAGRWHNYGCQLADGFSEDDDVASIQLNIDWMSDDLYYTVKDLWRRYKSIVEAYKTKVDWASGIINTTTYKDVKDTSVNNGESTDWALPNKKVDAPYGTPTSHSENNGGNTNTKTGAVETKGMLNPVTQRDLYAKLIRDAFGEMAEECAPLFNQMHL